MACCGKRVNRYILHKLSGSQPGNGASSIPLENGSIALQFIGEGSETFYGVTTGAQYKVNGNSLIVADLKDARTKSAKRPGLLELTKNGKLLFKEVRIDAN